MIRKNASILFTVACLAAALSLSSAMTAAQDPPLLTFNDLQPKDPIEGTFRIAGYVIDIYKCPPCPPGAMCKPCIPDNIVITDDVDAKDLSKIKRLRISTEKPEQFELKKQYTFRVKVKGKVPAGRAITDVELISFEAMKEAN